MDLTTSRSEKKRQAKSVESLAHELVDLPAADLKKLPCAEPLRQEIALAKTLKAGARKRQVKHIAKELRDLDQTPIYDFLSEKKGSRLRQQKEFHDLEQLRERIIDEALQAARRAQEEDEPLPDSWKSAVAETALGSLPSLDSTAVNQAAVRYARTRKPVYRREIFRQLRAARERLEFQREG